jgi:type VI secretion system secreted protein Hcp
MAFDAFLKIDGVDGESTRKGYEKQIPILSFSWGGSNPATIGVDGGGGAGKGVLSSLSIMKKSDASSPLIFQKCMEGEHIKSAKLTLMKAGGKAPIDFVVYELSIVYIDSVQYSGSQGGDDAPMESVSLTFGKMTYTFTPQTATGTKGSPVVGQWDITTVDSK